MFFQELQSWISHDEYEKAKRLLKAIRYWHQYLESFKQTAAELSVKPLSDLGTFSLVRDDQCEVERIDNNDSTESSKLSPIAHGTRGRAAWINRLQDPTTPTRRGLNPTQPDPPDVLDQITEFDTPSPPKSSAAMKSDILSHTFWWAQMWQGCL
jgi:hypothetical protein